MYVRTNEKVQTKQDVLFLINSLINRQEGYFNEQDILNLTIKYMTNSPIFCSEEELMGYIKHNLNISCFHGLVSLTEHGYQNITFIDF